MRLPFLVLTPACVAVGGATALAAGGPLDLAGGVLALVGAAGGHLAVNLINEWEDFRSGLDVHTERTPFSGGSGALPERPEAQRAVGVAALVALAATVAVGLGLTARVGPGLLALGVPGVAVVLAYTRWLNRDPWASIAAPAFGFGPAMVMGTHLVLAHRLDAAVSLASLVPAGAAAGLLLLNQIPDRVADARVGRRTLPVAAGVAATVRVHGALALATFAVPVVGVVAGVLPPGALAGLLGAPLALRAWQGARRHARDGDALLPALAANVGAAVLTPFAFAAGIALG
jgi:1,4-dihydroxy-2-naphthoate octaprenyltransferase